MGSDLTLLGALVATQNLTVDDAILLADYLDFADEIGAEPASVMSAVDLALDYFRPNPDEDAALTASAIAARAERAEEAIGEGRGVCPDCGEPSMMDSVDDEQSVDLWMAVRGIVDKYMWDQMQMHDHGEAEDC